MSDPEVKLVLIERITAMLSKLFGRKLKPKQIVALAEARAAEARTLGPAMKKLSDQGISAEYSGGELTLKAEAREHDPPLPAIAALDEASDLSTEQALLARGMQRQLISAARKERNFEGIVGEAVNQFSTDNGPVSDDPVDDDWATRFFSYAEDVSDREMQLIWARILTGEVRRPGSFSLRLLERLRTLSKKEAQTLQSLSPYVAEILPNGVLSGALFKTPNHDQHFRFDDLIILEEAGLANTSSRTLNIKSNTAQKTLLCKINSYAIVATPEEGVDISISVPHFSLTSEGFQLLRLARGRDTRASLEYIFQVAYLATSPKTKANVHQILKDDGLMVEFGPALFQSIGTDG
ncbi:MAG: DUF2806 domain-containing protein [Bacteroidota bacterium]